MFISTSLRAALHLNTMRAIFRVFFGECCDKALFSGSSDSDINESFLTRLKRRQLVASCMEVVPSNNWWPEFGAQTSPAKISPWRCLKTIELPQRQVAV